MIFLLKHTLVVLLILLTFFRCSAQQKWSSPEVEQMYHHAIVYYQMGNYPSAIITYKQALLLEPKNLLLYQGLGETFQKASFSKELIQTLSPILNNKLADAKIFVLVADAHSKLHNNRKARSIIDKGFQRFPASPLLFHQYGLVYENSKNTKNALNEWITGITKSPNYAPNYYEAARTYFNCKNYLDAIICGEIFINLEYEDTLKTYDIKKMIFASYQSMFNEMAGNISGKKLHLNNNIKPFLKNEQQIVSIYTNLTPVISDGVTTENLIMLRTRFLIEWFNKPLKDTIPLFHYQDNLIKNGWFDMYNQWMFGAVEDSLQFTAWNNFHPHIIDSFLNYQRINRLNPNQNKRH